MYRFIARILVGQNYMIEIVTNFGTLLRLARAQYEAEQTGDIDLIERARRAHDAYKELCLNANKMDIGIRLF